MVRTLILGQLTKLVSKTANCSTRNDGNYLELDHSRMHELLSLS